MLRLIENEELTSEGRALYMRQMCGALDTARAIIRSERRNTRDIMAGHIATEAEAREPEAYAYLADEVNGAPFVGDVHNAFADPALALGVALAYVVMMEGGAGK